MPPPEIERLCSAIVPGSGSIDVERLGAGLVSDTYRVVRGGAAYTLKVAAEDRPNLGLNPRWEVQVLERAAGAGLAPRLVYFDPDGAVLLMRWVEGRSWISHEAAIPANLDRIAALLRRVHSLALPDPERVVTPLQWIEIYEEALSQRASHSSDPALRGEALGRARAWLELPRPVGVVCHSDLHAMNLLEENDSLILLDWEYAHVTDPLWDLAGWSANNDLDTESQRGLLGRYLGRAPLPGEWQRLRLLLALYDYVCLLWTQLYLSVLGARANGAAERARLLDARLRLPAHYAA
jgi:thiamine kinase-like enzyme